jgi:hypothetical protein
MTEHTQTLFDLVQTAKRTLHDLKVLHQQLNLNNRAEHALYDDLTDVIHGLTIRTQHLNRVLVEHEMRLTNET